MTNSPRVIQGQGSPSSSRSGSSGSSAAHRHGRDLRSLHDDVLHDYLEYDDDFTATNDLAIARLIQQSYDDEDQRLALEIQELYYLPTFECKVCLDEHSEEDVAEVEGCWHRMCRDCMKGHITSQLEARVYPIMCPICSADKDLECPSGTSLYGPSDVQFLISNLDLFSTNPQAGRTARAVGGRIRQVY